MGHILADLLSAPQPEFGTTISNLEKVAGNPSVDVRLMSEIIQLSRAAVTNLGLDSGDIVGEELYYTLLNKVKIHDLHLAKHIGVKEGDSVDKIANSIKLVVEKTTINREVWSLKRIVAKRFIQSVPPERVMKYLNYTSVDSMIKRENIFEIFAAARLMETASWLKRFNKQYQQLVPSDFEERKIELLVMPSQRWSNLMEDLYKRRAYSLTHFKELGFIGVFAPSSQSFEGYTLSTLLHVIHYINEIRLYSAFFKMQQVKSNFGSVVARTLNEDDLYDIEISGKKLHWRVVQQYYGRSSKSTHPSSLQPYIQPEDLAWRRTEESLYSINPELNFWKSLGYVGVLLNSNQPISFNILDVSMNYYFAIDFQDRVYNHMQANLWSELYMRYLDHDVFEKQVRGQLGVTVTDPGRLRF